MSKRKTDVAKRSDLFVKPYSGDGSDLIEREHYALEYARLIKAVHEMVFDASRPRYADENADEPSEYREVGEYEIATAGLVILAVNDPKIYKAVARNGEAKNTAKAVSDAANVINDAFGLSQGLRVDGKLGQGAFCIKLF